MAKKLETEAEVAEAITRLTPAKRQLLINAMRTLYPNRKLTAKQVDQFLIDFVTHHKIPL